jgi:hypothetical protein
MTIMMMIPASFNDTSLIQWYQLDDNDDNDDNDDSDDNDTLWWW